MAREGKKDADTSKVKKIECRQSQGGGRTESILPGSLTLKKRGWGKKKEAPSCNESVCSARGKGKEAAPEEPAIGGWARLTLTGRETRQGIPTVNSCVPSG